MSDDHTCRIERSLISVALVGDGDCLVEMSESGAHLRTSKPRIFGGSGTAFSSTDLLAAALGTCIATDLEPLALRHGIPLSGIRVDVEKVLANQPKRLDSLGVHVQLPAGVPADVVRRFQHAAGHCVVHRSLDPQLRVTVTVGHPAD